MMLETIEIPLSLSPSRTAVVALPPHLYGELGKTVYGCEILQSSGHVEEYASVVTERRTTALEQRAALWALGQLGSSSPGFKLLQECAPDIVGTIAEYACTSPALSLRGTSFNVLGLFCHSADGRRALEELGWQWRCQNGAYIACPRDTRKLFQLPKYEYLGSPSKCAIGRLQPSVPLPPTDAAMLNLLSYIGRLPCAPAKDAPKSISTLRTSQPELFKSLGVYLHVVSMLENYSFPLNVRRSIHEQLFAKVPLTNEAWADIERKCEGIQYQNQNQSREVPVPAL
jgi:hypothetical protein